MQRALTARGCELRVVEVDSRELLDLYGAPLALIRPDQIVAWRGSSAADADAVAMRVTGGDSETDHSSSK